MGRISAGRLKGRRAIITGGSRGIGRAVALRFAAEGATVCLNHLQDEMGAEEVLKLAINASRELANEGADHFILEADIAEKDSADRLVDVAVERWGRIDIVVNNAGIMPPTPGLNLNPSVLRRVLDVNVLGAAYLASAAAVHFRSRPGGGVIINTSSVHEVIPKPGYIAYSISKGGLGNLTRTLALEYVRDGIRVNAVAPGAVVTAMNSAWIGDPDKKRAVERHIPMDRAAEADEIAPIFAFLASDEASYITGQTIFACGGLTLYADFMENWSS